MTLSTVDEDGHPDACVLIFKNFDRHGWHFDINADSPKGRQIIDVRSRGQPTARSLVARSGSERWHLLSRWKRTRRISWPLTSKQSHVMSDTDGLDQRVAEARTLLENELGCVSQKWHVYAVVPVVVQFWQGAEDRMHQHIRDEWTEKGCVWEKVSLFPQVSTTAFQRVSNQFPTWFQKYIKKQAARA